MPPAILNLPAISATANPDFRDVAACAKWLESLPLINVGPTHGRLLSEIEELNCCEISPSERLRILELLHEPVIFVQLEQAKKFANRAVPLAKPEREILLGVVALWGALGSGYQHCLQAFSGISASLRAGSGQMELACQRALWCATQQINEHYRCYQDVGGEEWKQLHQLYLFAEEHQLVNAQVAHPLQKEEWKTTCMETYVQALLLQLINPCEYTARQLGLISRWLDRWGETARLKHSYTDPGWDKPAPVLAVDLGGDKEPCQLEPNDASRTLQGTWRYLDVTALAKNVRERAASLKKGLAPTLLNLGDDVPAPLAEYLLNQMHYQWCEVKPQRTPARKSAPGEADLATGMGAMHYYITARPFRQPGDNRELSKAQREEIATFGRVSTHTEDNHASQHGFALERWLIQEESLAGMRLQRKEGPARFIHAQLIAARPSDARTFMLGTVRWLRVDGNYAPTLSVRAMPGVPQGIAIRATGLNAMTDKYIPALLLSAVPALRSPETLVLPVGWFRPKRVIEVFSDQTRQLALDAVIDRGSDFERVTFQAGS